jgi:glycosyltransferase involved in cell wall biosynthesis
MVASISVVMPAYRAAHYLQRSLPPLIDLRERGAVSEVIVVDDASGEPSTQETARRLGATVFSLDKNAGAGAARNFAVRQSSGDILWFVDADVIAHHCGPEKIRAALSEDPVGAVFGSYDNRPPETNFASTYKNLVHRFYHQHAKGDSDSFWSGCGAVRRAVFLEVGGFEEASFGRPAVEDVELGYRIRRAGWKIRLSHDLLGTHLKRWTLADVIRTDIFHRAVPWSNLILAGRGVNDDLNVSWSERLKAAVAWLWALSFAILLISGLNILSMFKFSATTLVVIAFNAPLIAFFAKERGAWFSFRALMFHQLYYLYSSATFAICMLRFRLTGGRAGAVPARRKPAAAE